MKTLMFGSNILLIVLTSCSAPIPDAARSAPKTDYVYMGLEAPSTSDEGENYQPLDGYVSNPKIAAAVAELIAKDFYGAAQIEEQKPYLVTKQVGVWIVRGSFPDRPGLKGGVFEVRLSSSDGRVVRMIHGK